MLNFLCAIETTAEKLDLASIILSSALSLILIGITFYLSLRSNKLTKDTSELPLRVEVVKSIMDLDKQFYNICTKLILSKSISQSVIDKHIINLDNLNTSIYCDILMKLECLFPQESEIYKQVKEFYDEMEILYLRMEELPTNFSDDLTKAFLNISDLNYNYLLKDIIVNDNNYSIFINGLSESSIKYFDSYRKAYSNLQKIDYKNFMS